jgi:hypothetical protein
MEGRYNAQCYIELLETVFPWAKKQIRDFHFQQDNAPIHTARKTIRFIEENGVPLVSWPTRSPDLSIIENVWHLLSQQVYQDGQFQNRADLIKKIESEAKKIKKSVVRDLYNGINERLIQVIEKKGDQIQ